MIQGLAPRVFLRDHWQKRPLLLRGAIPGFTSPLDGDELAGLAADADIESRLITTDGHRWLMRDGPFTAADFSELPEYGWTLLVQDVDKHLPDLAAVFDHFDFLPSWRVDDLMISWAEDGGSVGPHVDRYDVFLLQAHGLRRWRVGAPLDGPVPEQDGTLHILADFEAQDEWVLEPGDMLYLPPGVPHHGIAEGPCMTWSIGFRAPSLNDLVAEIAERAVAAGGDGRLYGDPDLDADEARGGRLSARAAARAERLVDGAWQAGKRELARVFAELVTSPKAWLHCVPPPVLVSAATLVERIHSGLGLMRDPRARMLWMDDGDGTVLLCVDGRCAPKPASLSPLLETLCAGRAFPAEALARYLDGEGPALLAELYNGGQLVEAADTDTPEPGHE